MEPIPKVNIKPPDPQKGCDDSVDHSAIAYNLSLSPTDRLLQHQASLSLMLELKRKGEILREQSQSDS